MRVLVTGAAGFIGSNLVKRLKGEGHDAVAVDNFSSGDWRNLTDFDGDIVTANVSGDLSALARMEPFGIIFHQASITDTTVTDQRLMMTNNVEGFRNILELAAKWESRVIWASSASIYGQGPAPMREMQEPQPLNVYAYSKLAMERLAARYIARVLQPIVGLRYFNVYGPGEAHKGKFASMIWQLAQQMRSGKRPRIFVDGEQKRDFVHVADVVQANLKAMGVKASGTFNVGSGRAETFNEVVRQLNRVLKTNLPPDYFENPYGFTQDWTQADLAESRKTLGYEPQYDVAKGVEQYIGAET